MFFHSVKRLSRTPFLTSNSLPKKNSLAPVAKPKKSQETIQETFVPFMQKLSETPLKMHEPPFSHSRIFSTSNKPPKKPMGAQTYRGSNHLISVRKPQKAEQQSTPNSFLAMMINTFLNALSKLWPGGFGWQGGAEAAMKSGCGLHDGHFCFWAGLGDFLGVGSGHIIYKLLQYIITLFANNTFGTNYKLPVLKDEIMVALQLASASLLSGTAWQPVLDAIKHFDLGFYPSAMLTGSICALIFFCGLRLARVIYPVLLGADVIAKPNKNNLFQDGLLAAIGINGSSAAFVLTDTGFADNPLKDVLGADKDPLENMKRAGISTFSGFFFAQTLQNMITSFKNQLAKKSPDSETATVENQSAVNDNKTGTTKMSFK